MVDFFFSLIKRFSYDYSYFCSAIENEKRLSQCKKKNRMRTNGTTIDEKDCVMFAFLCVYGDKLHEEWNDHYSQIIQTTHNRV